MIYSAIFAFIVVVSLFGWKYSNQEISVPAWTEEINGMLYYPAPSDFDFEDKNYSTPEQLEKDIQIIASRAHSIYVYLAWDGMEILPELAKKYGIKLMLVSDITPVDEVFLLFGDRNIIKKQSEIKKRLMAGHEDYFWFSTELHQQVEHELIDELIIENKKSLFRLVNTVNQSPEVVSGVLLSHGFLHWALNVRSHPDTRKILENHIKYKLIENFENAPDQFDEKINNKIDEQLDGYVNYLVENIKTVKNDVNKDIRVAVSEPSDVWLKYPKLVNAVDFIGVYICPYWEGVSLSLNDADSGDDAVTYVFKMYRELQTKYPGKPIVITEVGWPSTGPDNLQAEPSFKGEYYFLNRFVRTANTEKIEYYLTEAFDQPWKVKIEGEQGAYWGFFNADRQPKFQ